MNLKNLGKRNKGEKMNTHILLCFVENENKNANI